MRSYYYNCLVRLISSFLCFDSTDKDRDTSLTSNNANKTIVGYTYILYHTSQKGIPNTQSSRMKGYEGGKR